MTKAELIESLEGVSDDALICISIFSQDKGNHLVEIQDTNGGGEYNSFGEEYVELYI